MPNPKKELHVGDKGTVLVLAMKKGTTPVNIAGAVELEIILQPPQGQGANKLKPATLSSNGADGRLQCVIESGDLHAAGDWKKQARVKLSAEQEWHSQVLPMPVLANL